MSVPVPTFLSVVVGQISRKFRSLSFGGVETKLRTIYYNQVVFMILGIEIYFTIVLIFRAFHVCEISMDQVTILNDFFHGPLSIFQSWLVNNLPRDVPPLAPTVQLCSCIFTGNHQCDCATSPGGSFPT